MLSIYRVAFNFRFTIPGDLFPNIDRIRDIQSPVFIIHGTRDEVRRSAPPRLRPRARARVERPARFCLSAAEP
jgi:pimeloyl-ACP methyl ester carboxylesterase